MAVGVLLTADAVASQHHATAIGARRQEQKGEPEHRGDEGSHGRQATRGRSAARAVREVWPRGFACGRRLRACPAERECTRRCGRRRGALRPQGWREQRIGVVTEHVSLHAGAVHEHSMSCLKIVLPSTQPAIHDSGLEVVAQEAAHVAGGGEAMANRGLARNRLDWIEIQLVTQGWIGGEALDGLVAGAPSAEEGAAAGQGWALSTWRWRPSRRRSRRRRRPGPGAGPRSKPW